MTFTKVGLEYVAKGLLGSEDLTYGLHYSSGFDQTSSDPATDLNNEPTNANYSRQTVPVEYVAIGEQVQTETKRWGVKPSSSVVFDLSDVNVGDSDDITIDSVFVVGNFDSVIGGGVSDYVIASLYLGTGGASDTFTTGLHDTIDATPGTEFGTSYITLDDNDQGDTDQSDAGDEYIVKFGHPNPATVIASSDISREDQYGTGGQPSNANYSPATVTMEFVDFGSTVGYQNAESFRYDFSDVDSDGDFVSGVRVIENFDSVDGGGVGDYALYGPHTSTYDTANIEGLFFGVGELVWEI